MPYFLCKLIPAPSLEAGARGVALAHQDYWLPYLNAGLVIVMGPVWRGQRRLLLCRRYCFFRDFFA